MSLSMCETEAPTSAPTTATPTTMTPTQVPTPVPTPVPTTVPSAVPTTVPTPAPSAMPTTSTPTTEPSYTPSAVPSPSPSNTPSMVPSHSPSDAPSVVPSQSPSDEPSSMPSPSPTALPSASPTVAPSSMPSATPSAVPSSSPTAPTDEPTLSPTTACEAKLCDGVVLRTSSEYSISPGLPRVATATSSDGIDAMEFSDECTDTTQITEYQAAVPFIGSIFGDLVVVVSFPEPVTDPVLFFGIRNSQVGETTFTFGNDFCIIQGAVDLGGKMAAPVGSGTIVDTGTLLNFRGGAIAIPGVHSAIGFTVSGPLPVFTFGWQD
mmetsp:Transcript_26900/g.41233  ORF Transcript_26900/g.41233 Transcript_26900/m.41233 type:complete len:321 (+) Transcript_26900:378-1340(+)